MRAVLAAEIFDELSRPELSDAALILDLLYTHTARLRPFEPDTVEFRTLQLLVEARRDAVEVLVTVLPIAPTGPAALQ